MSERTRSRERPMAGREIKFRAKKSESGCHTNAGNGSSQS